MKSAIPPPPSGCAQYANSVAAASACNGSSPTTAVLTARVPFRKACRWLGITTKRTRPYRPQTNGKAERMIQTLLRKWAYATTYPTSNHRRATLAAWLQLYNEERPHASLHKQTPVSRLAQF